MEAGNRGATSTVQSRANDMSYYGDNVTKDGKWCCVTRVSSEESAGLPDRLDERLQEARWW